MTNKKVLVLGNFGYAASGLNGQTIKTQEIYNLIKSYSPNKVMTFDSQELRHRPLIIIALIVKFLKANIFVYLPGQNNLETLFPIIWFLSRIKRVTMIYPVVGGWLDEYICGKPKLIKRLQQFDFIGVESDRLKKNLEKKFGFKNVENLPNFRSEHYTPYKNKPTTFLRLVFMARITEDKGCNIIFQVAKKITESGINNIRITFYGIIDSSYKELFDKNLSKFKSICEYGGIIAPSQVCEVLNKHDILLLPTYYEGEGFPGSIVDAYRAGIPVIVSKWKDLPEFVIEGKTGYVIPEKESAVYLSRILKLSENYEFLETMKSAALVQSKNYSADAAWTILRPHLK